jgi:hypothetical protein
MPQDVAAQVRRPLAARLFFAAIGLLIAGGHALFLFECAGAVRAAARLLSS